MSTAEVHKAKIMITRPAHQAGNLIKNLQNSGTEVFAFPTIAIEPIKLQDNALASPLNQYHIIIFISPNAVEHSASLLSSHKESLQKVKFATVGQGSARSILNLLGRQADIIPEKEFNSEGLLSHPQLQDVANKRILIIKGKGGRETLRETLQQRGAQLEEIDVYQRVMPDINNQPAIEDLQNHTIAAIVITSGEAIKNLVAMLPSSSHSELFKVPLILVNQRQAEIARESGFHAPVYLSVTASDDSIINCLIQNGLVNPMNK